MLSQVCSKSVSVVSLRVPLETRSKIQSNTLIMGVRRKTLILGFSIALFLVVAVYFHLWSMDSMDSSFTSDDRETLRREFERANLEVMDESAQWRMKYDGEVERSRQFQEELLKVKDALVSANKDLAMLQKEKADLQKEVVSLTPEVEAKRRKCNCGHTKT